MRTFFYYRLADDSFSGISVNVGDHDPPPPVDGCRPDETVPPHITPAMRTPEQQRVIDALAIIQQLEQQQARPVRELALDPNSATARTRLAEIEARIAQLREIIDTAS